MIRNHKSIRVLEALFLGKTVKFGEYDCVMIDNKLAIKAENITKNRDSTYGDEES